jgi:glycosyltransferase involved in cell wall biosynthesis
MQGVQTDSRHRGIGRYCLAITDAFIDIAHDHHDIGLLFNAALNGIDEAIETLGSNVRRRAFGPVRYVSSDNRANDARRQAAEIAFSHSLEADRPDIVWLGSVVEGFTDDALAPHAALDCLSVATLYDLIPLHDPTEYLANARAREWYTRRLEVLKRCDVLLAISEWVRNDAITRLGIDPARVVAIGAGVDDRFTPPPEGVDHADFLSERFGITRPFVLYNGGFDKRKNVLSLVDAFADLPTEVRTAHILVIVGRVPPPVAARFKIAMKAHSLTANDVVFTGFVSDEDLVRLYQSCALFVFPSEREGFGLPPLEAMACGAPTIVNNATSLPEVVGEPTALFDGRAEGALTRLMQAVLDDDKLALRLAEVGLERARHFSWRAVATRALTVLEERVRRREAKGPDAGRSPFDVPIYHADASNVEGLLPTVRQWPGPATWRGPLPSSGPTLLSDRFRLGGYARLSVPGSGKDWLTLLELDAAGVLVTDQPNQSDLVGKLRRLCVDHPIARQRHAEDAIAKFIAPSLTDDDLARIADALDRSRSSPVHRWLVDVTHIAANDLGTGVHRVVRSILHEWLLHPPEGVRIEPIAFSNGRFHHAHGYACALVGVPLHDTLPGDIVSITGNETYVGLDWGMESLPSSASMLRTWRRAGVAMHFVVYDLLPLTMPEVFHGQSRESAATWMAIVASIGDALHCISRHTASEVKHWMEMHQVRRSPRITTFALGAEPDGQRQVGTLEPALKEVLASAPSLLMVGTLEPRKGHTQVLDAMELLWETGVNAVLVIVGHRGWLMNDLIDRLRHHRENGKRLFWLEDADDTTLEGIYHEATVLVAASRGEGYGLPLIEAARRGKPVIARSLPVFHEVAGEYPSYFSTDSAADLATHIARWLATRPSPGSHPEWLTWRQSAISLCQAIMHGDQASSIAPPLSQR